MRRERSEPRAGWEDTVRSQGLVYGTPARGSAGSARPYWDESVHYVFEMDEILAMEADVEVLHSMCLEAVEHVVLAIHGSSGNLSEGLVATAVYGLIGVVAQVAGVRVLELGTSIQIGPLLAKKELDSSSFVVAAAHLALGLIVAAAIL